HRTSTISVRDDSADAETTEFNGYEIENARQTTATLRDIVEADGKTFLVFSKTSFYAEMGGQIGDRGSVTIDGHHIQIANTIKDPAGRHLHQIKENNGSLKPGAEAKLEVDLAFRNSIQRHHTATHLLHNALREVLGTHVRQAGSLVAEDRLRFDFAHFEAISPEDIRRIETIVNRRILENAPVRWFET